MAGVKLYIFDADGTLRWTTVPGQKYPLSAAEWRLMPQVKERLRAIPWSADGPWLAIASNQNGVAEGLLSAGLARRLIADMLREALGGIPPRTRILMCTCPEEAGCGCRKPEPGMLLQHLANFGVPGSRALFVGDLPIDAEAARRAGIAFRFAADFFAENLR